jgi:hypothetical protein
MRFFEVSSGSEYSCGVTIEQRLSCWFDTGFESLGDGSEADYQFLDWIKEDLPVDDPVSLVDANAGHACALTTDGAVVCLGMGVGETLEEHLGLTETWDDALDESR